MKKKICSVLLAVALVLSAMPALVVGAGALTIDAGCNTGSGHGGGGGALSNNVFSSAVVRNTGATGAAHGTAQNLEVVITLKDFGSKNSLYALVMKAADYNTLVPMGPKTAGIDHTNYFSQKVTAANYAIGRKNPVSGTAGSTITLPLVEASAPNDSALGSDAAVASKLMPKAAVTADDYYEEYVLVVFSTQRDTDDNYYVDRFYVDADGYVCTPSYLIRYNDNNPVGTGSVGAMPTRTIVRAYRGESLGASSSLSGTSPTRNGYTFKGWADTKAKADAGTVDYAAGASYTTPANLYKIYDLYAVWESIPVAFAMVGASKDQTIAGEARVGVSFTQTFDLASTSDARSAKTYTVTGLTVDGVTVTDAAKYPNNIPAGLSIVSQTGNKTWKLSGTPKYDCDKPIVMTVKVTDQSNTTVDTMKLTIPKIEKGLQPKPDTTVNTGLASQMVDDGDEATPDGRLIGFYAKGQTEQKDGADAVMNDKTGTLTAYYLGKGMVYEYRPKTEQSDGLWREIPAPKSLYGAPTDWADFEASLVKGAVTRYKTTITSATAAAYEVLTAGEAWPDTYGAIAFDEDGRPVVTGLEKDAVYEVRFRSNATYDASLPTEVIVGGASGGASTGPADPSDFASITFYDWDETLLGSIVVPKNADASADVQAFADARIAETSELDPKYLWYSDEKMEADKNDSAKTPKYFSNKKGYDFDTWLLNDSTTFTANDEALPSYGGADDAAATAAGVADFRTMTENLIVKASYKANETLNRTAYDEESGTWSGTNISYTFSSSRYARYGNVTTDRAGTYGIIVSALRENSYGFGVRRLEEPAIRATMVTDTELTGSAVTVYTISDLVNQDNAPAEIAPTKMIAQVTYAVLDKATTNSWPTANTASANKVEKKNAGTIGSDGFIKFGTLAFINQQAVLLRAGETNNWSWVNAKAFEDAGLSIQAAGNVNEAKSRISSYFNNHPDIVELSYAQLQDVIDKKMS